MITDDVKRELDYRYHYLLGTFGGVDNYIDALKSRLNLKGFIYPSRTETKELLTNISYLLNHPGPVHIISPWSIFIDLFNNEGGIYHQDSIVFEEPYSIYNTKGKLLYSVTGHNGVFGNSILDKSLVLQSQSTDMYYIQYPTYTGTYITRLLLINLISLTNPVVNDSVDSPVVINEEVFSQMTFTFTGTTHQSTSLEIYYLPSAPVRIPTKEALRANPYSERISISIEYSNTFVFNPIKSGWITITKQTGLVEVPMKIKNVLGQGIDRFLTANEEQYVYYLALGDEVDIVAIQNSLGVRSTRPPAVSSSNLINLTAVVEE